MKLIVGLGNYGKEYDNTRHNIGFNYIDLYAKYLNTQINNSKFNGLYVKTRINKEEVMLLKPCKYMNLSGEVIRKYVDYFKINIEDILIISDDLDLELGKIKLKYKGSSGGHNGLKDIEKNLGTNEYKRLKIGVSNNKNIDTKDYVLSKFKEDELKIINNMNDNIISLLEDYSKLNFDKLMSKYNN